MTDPLQYLRDLAIAKAPVPRSPGVRSPATPRLRGDPPAPAEGFADPRDLPALALAMLAEGRATRRDSLSDRRLLQRCALADGTDVCLPIRYFDARCLIAAFSVEPARVQALLNDVGLRPAGGEAPATVLFGCFEYRDTDLGPYNEVGLSIPAVAPGDANPAFYVLHLPVTTAETDRIGRELWGYPKFVAGIDIRGDAGAFSTTLRDPASATIATLEGGAAVLAPQPAEELPTYTHLHGRLLRTRIQPLTPFQVGDGAGFRLKVGPSSHAMAKALTALGLDGARPSQVRYAEPFQAMLFPGFPV